MQTEKTTLPVERIKLNQELLAYGYIRENSIFNVLNPDYVERRNLPMNQNFELLKKNGFPKITTEIQNFKNFYYAEEYHQQYLLKNPNGYCGIGGCNVSYNN